MPEIYQINNVFVIDSRTPAIVGIYHSPVGFIINFPIFEEEVMQSCSQAVRRLIARSACGIIEENYE
jgi:hypothetical protein